MARKETVNQETSVQGSEYLAVEKLKEINKIPDAVHQGICVANGWQKGRMVTPKEYWEARRRFLGAAIGGNKR